MEPSQSLKPESASEAFSSFPRSLFISLNGSLAEKGKTVGGGDMVLFKFITLSGTQPDVLIPESAASFVSSSGKIFHSAPNNQLTLFGIIWLFVVRIFQGLFWSFRNKQTYDIALAASPFGVDVIPVWFWKAKNKGAVIYHINPKRKAVNLTTRIRFCIAAFEQWITMRILNHACDFIVAGNEFVKGQLQKRLPGKPIYILPAGFDAGFIDRISAVQKDPHLACFVGRLVSQKGIFDLVKVMANLAKTHPQLRLVMAGTGPERDFLVAEIKRLNLTNIDLAGFVSEEEKISLLKKSTYFFFPSYEEGWGIALAEALYCECRCLCYELPHYRSIFCEYPVYARLGDSDDFVRAFRESSPVSAEQRTFLRQYDDPLVVQQMVEHLTAVATGIPPANEPQHSARRNRGCD